MHGKNFIKNMKGNIFIKAFIKFIKDDGFEHAGYIAFLTLFAIIPIFMIIMSAMSLLYNTNAGIQTIESVIHFLPDYALSVVSPQINEIFAKPSGNFISFVFLGAVWTTSSSLEGMRMIFNKIYKVSNPPSFIITRLVSILQFFTLILFTIVAVAIFTILPQIVHLTENILHKELPNLANPYTSTLITILILTGLISAIYLSLTNKKLSLLEVLPGTLLTISLWYVSTHILTYYLVNLSDFNLVYGSLTGVIIMMIFFYMINIILLYGAEINYLFKKNHQEDFKKYNDYCKKILKPFPPQKKSARK